MLISSFDSGNFEISIYNSLKNGIADKWNNLNSDNLNSDYLCFLQESKPVDIEFLYVIVEEKKENKNEICAILYFQILKFTKKNIDLKSSFILNTISKIIFSLRSFKILISGNIFAVNFPSICFNSSINHGKIFEIVSDVQSRINPDIFILKDLDTSFTSGELKNPGWIPYKSDLTMTLNIDPTWKTFENYISSLSKKYKKRAQKIILAGNSMIRRGLDANEIKERTNEIKKLFDQVAKNQTIRMCLISSDYFYLYKKKFPEAFSFVGYFLKDELVGFSTYMEHNKELEIHYIGIDYSYNKDLMIYFNILFDGVKKAIESGKEQLELGRTAREAKANLGAIPVYFNDYLKIKGAFASFLIRKFSNYFQSELGDQWTEKHPFRK